MAKTIKRLDDLQPDSSNANKGTVRGRGMVEASLRETGAGRSILADREGRIIAGNKTLEAWADIGGEIEVVRTNGDKLVVVQREDLDLADDTGTARKLAYYDNRAGEVGLEWDAEQLLADINAGMDLSSMFRDDELDALLADLQPEPEVNDPGPQVDRAEELRQKWQVETGQLWQLGDHRLVCGDCTDAEVVARVMDGEKADMVFTDPPYNVAYQSNESVESLKARNRRTDGMIVENDAMSDDEFDAFLDAFLSAMPLKQGGAYYLCAPPGRPETQFRNALDRVSGLALRECIVWVKDRFVFGRQDYHWRHESILYGWREGESHYFVDDRTQDTVWEIARPTVSEFHPTMKPVELPAKAIGNSCKRGAVVYDPFLGSGTTLIACEQLGRKCRAVEISEAYTAVALERYFQATSKTPVLVGKLAL